MCKSAWSVVVCACCPRLIINGFPPFALNSVLVGMINYTSTLLIRLPREKHYSPRQDLTGSRAVMHTGCGLLGGEGALSSACGGQKGHFGEAAVQRGLKGEMEDAAGESSNAEDTETQHL